MLYAGSYDPAGRLVRSYGASLPDHLAAMIAGEALPVAAASRMLTPDRDWWDGTAWGARPVPPAPPALVAGVEAVWGGLPVGAVVTVVDPLTGLPARDDDGAPVAAVVDEGGTLPITLIAGPWRLSVNEVFPAVAASWIIEVSPE